MSSICEDCGNDAPCYSLLCELCELLHEVVYDGSDATRVLLKLQAVLLSSKKIPAQCCNCGWDKHIQIDYKIPPEQFIGSKISIINSDFNIVPLCPNCDWELFKCSEAHHALNRVLNKIN